MKREPRSATEISTVIFDLSEVLISGLIGIETHLADRLKIPANEVLSAFRYELDDLCCGLISEDAYVSGLLQRYAWAITCDEMKAHIRQNFHRKVPGMEAILSRLGRRYRLVLLSDNAFEWVSYIEDIHPFLKTFDPRLFSYQLRQVKRDPSTFTKVLAAIERRAVECVFIDDNHNNVSAARTAGLQAIAFCGSRQLLIDLRSLNLILPERKLPSIKAEA